METGWPVKLTKRKLVTGSHKRRRPAVGWRDPLSSGIDTVRGNVYPVGSS